MEAAKGILAVLATVFLAADCFFPSAKREETIRQIPASQPSCVERQQSCWLLMDSYPALKESLIDVYYNQRLHRVDNIDAVCLVHQQFRDCLQSLFGECSSYQDYTESLLCVGDYICSEAGRALLLEATNSSCYSDHGLFYAELYYSCMHGRMLNYSRENPDDSQKDGDDYQKDEDDSLSNRICQYEKRVKRCTVQVAAKQCGQAVAALVQALNDRRFVGIHSDCYARCP